MKHRRTLTRNLPRPALPLSGTPGHNVPEAATRLSRRRHRRRLAQLR